jgi:hypothetical protein
MSNVPKYIKYELTFFIQHPQNIPDLLNFIIFLSFEVEFQCVISKIKDDYYL